MACPPGPRISPLLGMSCYNHFAIIITLGAPCGQPRLAVTPVDSTDSQPWYYLQQEQSTGAFSREYAFRGRMTSSDVITKNIGMCDRKNFRDSSFLMVAGLPAKCPAGYSSVRCAGIVPRGRAIDHVNYKYHIGKNLPCFKRADRRGG